MQDPEAVSPYGPSMIWRIDTTGADIRKLFGYEDMEQLSKGFPSKVGTRLISDQIPVSLELEERTNVRIQLQNMKLSFCLLTHKFMYTFCMNSLYKLEPLMP